jgi:O-antigen/teichoic acid export membrane protein
MDDKKGEYKTVLKATGIFGGTQIFVILSGLIRSKIVAVLIGPVGVGISAIYNNILLMITAIVGLGIGSSAIREIAKEKNHAGRKKIAKITKNLILYLSIAGLLITLIGSYPLSELMFGNSNYIIGFCIVSFAVFFTVLSEGYNACLKGFQAMKKIALVSLYSSIVNVFIALVMFYFWRDAAIPYVIALNALALFLINYYYTQSVVNTSDINLTLKETLKSGKPMIVLGIMLVISSLLDYFVINVINVIITRKGSLTEVGLYQGAMQITAMSINLFFAAIANDYYPRLSGLVHQKEKFNSAVNTQAIIALLLMAPIINMMIVASPLLIRLFLSSEFIGISDFIYWILSGALFIAVSWCLYYVPLAYGDTKRFLYMTIISVIIKLCIQIPMYLFWGLKGIAIGNAVSTLSYAVIAYFFFGKIYQIRFNKELFQVLGIVVLLSLLILISEIIRQSHPVFLISEIIGVGAVCLYSSMQLNKYTNLLKFITNKIKK